MDKENFGQQKYKISPKSCVMLVEFLGTDLSKISNELEKLTLVVPPTTEITPDLIEEHIGISKDFNNFELKKAIGERNVKRYPKLLTTLPKIQRTTHLWLRLRC